MGCQRFIYNAKVPEDRRFRAFARKSLQHAGQFAPRDQQYAQFIGEGPEWLREVPPQVLRNGAVGWKQAYGRSTTPICRGRRPIVRRMARYSPHNMR